MKKIFKSLLTIGVVALVAGSAATAAYYTYQVSSNGNTVQTGTLSLQLNEGTSSGPALVGTNMYPGAFVESAGFIHNNGTIRVNPAVSLANASDPGGLASKLWLQIWTNGKLWYNDWLTNAPGYTSNKLVLDSLDPGQTINVAFRLILDESATATGNYSVDANITGFQWNDPDGATTTPADLNAAYVINTWSYNVCGTRPSSTYYTYDGGIWATHSLPDSARGTNSDGSCTVPF